MIDQREGHLNVASSSGNLAHLATKKGVNLGVEKSCNHLLEHDLVGTLDEVLPDRLSDVRVAMDEVICPENVHGRHIVNGSKLLGQARVPVKKFWMTANVIMSTLS